jgi:hypothetical protein
VSQKDVSNEGNLKLKPIYMVPFILESLWVNKVLKNNIV